WRLVFALQFLTDADNVVNRYFRCSSNLFIGKDGSFNQVTDGIFRFFLTAFLTTFLTAFLTAFLTTCLMPDSYAFFDTNLQCIRDSLFNLIGRHLYKIHDLSLFEFTVCECITNRDGGP